MSQWDKLLDKIITLSKDLRFEELRKVMEHYGYTMKYPGSGSSHASFRKSGRSIVTIPNNEPIKRAYIEKVRTVVESEEAENNDA
ncbi:MAG: type II toxin-antitoxin system HicA family toxin [Oscillospiraceae bacterium]|nr:type II toxin-antitoxin system HicA family toxin [Oscillospiraceae bacterium]